jgi:two-component sensor histidine kinase
MMKPLLRYLLLAFFVFPLGAQPPAAPDILREGLKHSPADTNRVLLLLDLAQFYQCKPGEKVQDLDSALLLARQAVALSQSLGFYRGEGKGHLLLAKALREKGALPQGKRQAEQAMAIAQKYGYADLTGSVYSEFTRYYSNTGVDVASKIRLNEQALAFFVRAGDRKKEADVLKDQGDLHQLQENYRQSLRELHRALALYRSVRHPDVQGVYDLLGFVSTKTGDYKSGLAYGLEALKTAKQRGDTSLYLCTIYNRLGLTYQALGQLVQAHEYFKLSLAVARQYNHIPSIVYLSGNISSIFLSMGKPREALSVLRKIDDKYAPTDFESRIILATRLMDAYGRLGQYERAQPYCNQVLELVGKYGAGSPGLAAVYQSVIGFLLDSRQYEAARKYLRINQALCEQQGSAGSLASNHLQWFRLDSLLRSYLAAIGHYQRYVALRDSLLTETKSQQMAQLEVHYQTEKKDQELRFKENNIQLLTERGKLQSEQLRQARMIRNGSIAGAIMLVLLLGLGYNRYRLKQRSNRLLEAKQREINEKNRSLEQVLGEKEGLLEEKEWMLKEIHHRVRNNLQIVISLLNSQAAKLSDDSALSTIKESQHRVQAMALIHQKLYQSEQVARVDMGAYIKELIVYLRDAYQQPGPVHFNLSVQPLELDVTLAVPLGLIINEAVTNALKYAFPGDRAGTVTLSLTPVGGTSYELGIADDGVGLPPGYDPARSRSLGMTLMHGLSEQLDGTLLITGPPGVSIHLTFRDGILGATYSGADHTYQWHRSFPAPPPCHPDGSRH